MKIQEICNPDFGKVFSRISQAFHRYLPVEWTTDTNQADFILLHTVGGLEYQKFFELPTDRVINLQWCYFTTDMPLDLWENVWTQAYCNVSFHDLTSYTDKSIRFYRTPLGAEPEIFYPAESFGKPIKVFATGHVAPTECLDLIYQACVDTNSIMLHTGENFRWDSNHYLFMEYMSDVSFANYLRKSKYIAGLRLIEGFEAMCIEGAMCGAVPIVPDLPTYSYYQGFAKFIDTKLDIKNQLVNLFNEPYVPLTEEQIAYVRTRFAWEKIIKDFYGEVLK